jgi:hypothetical protein
LTFLAAPWRLPPLGSAHGIHNLIWRDDLPICATDTQDLATTNHSFHLERYLSQVHLGYDDALHIFSRLGDNLLGKRPQGL